MYWPHLRNLVIASSEKNRNSQSLNYAIETRPTVIMCVWMYRTSSLKLQSIFPCFIYHSYTWLACIAPPISRHVYVYCVNGESQIIIVTPLKLPVSERGDCSGLVLLHERDMRSRDCRGDGGSTAVDECTLESLKKNMFYEPYPGVSSVIICTVISFHCVTIQYKDRMDWSLAGSSVPRINLHTASLILMHLKVSHQK